jgi:hypothetical protein
MKNLLYYVIAVLLSWSTVEMRAQVTIGSLNDPHEGAILDLQSETKGLLFPRVALNNVKIFQLCDAELDIAAAEGMAVFNTKASISGGYGKGIYVWYDKQWYPLYTEYEQEDNFTIDESTTVEERETITLTADKPVTWEVDGPTTYGDIESSTDSDCIVLGVKAGGTVIIKATHSQEVSKTWTVDVTAASTPDPLSCDDGYLVISGAYEPRNSNNVYTGGGTFAAIISSGTFTYIADLCIHIDAYGMSSWSEAKDKCPTGWRVPNLAELAHLNGEGNNFSTTHTMPLSSPVWSSTVTDQGAQWYFTFDSYGQIDGLADNTDDADNVNLRCVRTILQS